MAIYKDEKDYSIVLGITSRLCLPANTPQWLIMYFDNQPFFIVNVETCVVEWHYQYTNEALQAILKQLDYTRIFFYVDEINLNISFNG